MRSSFENVPIVTYLALRLHGFLLMLGVLPYGFRAPQLSAHERVANRHYCHGYEVCYPEEYYVISEKGNQRNVTR